MAPLAILERDSSVGVLTLNRPERHNSLIPEMLEQLLSALEAVEEDSGLRSLVLRANGRSFSTGGDISGFYENRENLPAYADRIVGLLNECILGLLDLQVPVIAAVNGVVTGGSLGFILAADVVLATPMVSFTPYYAVVGFSPDGGWTAMLPAVIGVQRTARTLLFNETITAEQAQSWGLVHEVAPLHRLDELAMRKGVEAAGLNPGTHACVRELLLSSRSLHPGGVEVALEEERRRFVSRISSPDVLEGMERFLQSLKSEKRGETEG